MAAADIRVLIADDEPAARRGVRQLLAAHPAFTVVGECRDGSEVLAQVDALAPDVIFLDVQMPGVDGFEVIRRRTPERMPAVVFLTAYDQFAIRAFEAQALDYLLKPVTEARFATTVQRLRRRLAESRAAAAPPPEPAPEHGVAVPTAHGLRVLPVGAIDWVEASGNYARLWSGGRGHLVRESLRALEERLATQGFRRAHRRALVRLAAVQELARTRRGNLVALLKCGARIRISRRQAAAFATAVRDLCVRTIVI